MSVTFIRRHVLPAPSTANDPLLNVTDHTTSTLPRNRTHPPPFLQATGLLTSVCANSNKQVYLPLYLLSLFTWLIHTQKFLPCLLAAVCSRLPITCTATAQPQCCLLCYTVPSVVYAQHCCRLAFSISESGNGEIRYLEDRCKIHIVTAILNLMFVWPCIISTTM